MQLQNQQFRSVHTFTATKPGTYTITASGANTTLTVGPGFGAREIKRMTKGMGNTFGGAFGGVALLFLSGLLGLFSLITAVVTLARNNG